jgi:ABC-type lipoprotein export system ATPase subunit
MMLRVNNLSKEFKGTFAVNSISFDVNSGDYVAIIGPSGSGKTTLLSLLTGLISPSEGEVLYDNQKLSNLSRSQMAKLRARELGMIFQFSELVPNLTIEENILLPVLFTRKFSEKEYHSKCEFLIERLDMQDIRHALPRELSGGQIQKASIARSLINDPSLLVADEPSGDLDPDNSNLVQMLLMDYNKMGLTILLVTHDMTLAFDAKTIYEMKNGSFSQVIKS